MFTNSLSLRTARTPLLGTLPVIAVEEILAIVLEFNVNG